MSPALYEFLIFLLPILLALTLHEFAHAYIADRLGDPTARLLGRVSLNPLVHIDPMGTLLLVLVHFGWGKPVPVDPRFLRHPRRDMALIALAGPLANLLTAVIFGLGLRLTASALDSGSLVAGGVRATVLISLLLACFNLLPLPPLDGSKILVGLLPASWGNLYQRYSGPLSWALLIVIVAGNFTNVNILGPLIGTPTRWLYQLIVGSGF